MSLNRPKNFRDAVLKGLSKITKRTELPECTKVVEDAPSWGLDVGEKLPAFDDNVSFGSKMLIKCRYELVKFRNGCAVGGDR